MESVTDPIRDMITHASASDESTVLDITPSDTSTTSIFSTFTDSVDWDYKSMFARHKQLNNTQLGIIYTLLLLNNDTIPVIRPTSSVSKSNEQFPLHAFHEVASAYTSAYMNYFDTTDTIHINDFYDTLYSYLDNGATVRLNNQYRARTFMLINENGDIQSGSTDPSMLGRRRITDIEYILSCVRNNIHKAILDRTPVRLNRTFTPQPLPSPTSGLSSSSLSVTPSTSTSTTPIHTSIIAVMNAILDVAPIVAHAVFHDRPPIYVRPANRLTRALNSPKIALRHDVIIIPIEVRKMFKRPSKYFDELSTMLVLNDADGFYSYKASNGTLIPVICKHEWLYFIGQSLVDIALECYLHGKCKYCGRELAPYHERVHESVPPKVFSLIYSLIEALNENVDRTLLMNAIMTIVMAGINKHIDNSIKQYDLNVIALTSLYLYIIYTATQKTVKWKRDVTKMLDSIKRCWADVGWSQHVVDGVLASNVMANDINDPTALIQRTVYSNKIRFIDMLPLSILFATDVDPTNMKGLKGTTNAQKLWLKGMDAVRSFNEVFEKTLMLLWKQERLGDEVKRLRNVKVDVEYKLKEVNGVDRSDDGFRFWRGICGTYCPANMNGHVWKGDECGGCGLKKDGGNERKVFDRWKVTITDSYLQRPAVMGKERFEIEPRHAVTEIEKCNEKDLFEKVLVVENYMTKKSLEDGLKDETKRKKVVEMLTTMLSLWHVGEEKWTEVFVRKCLVYVVKAGVKQKDGLLMELIATCFTIDNVRWLV